MKITRTNMCIRYDNQQTSVSYTVYFHGTVTYIDDKMDFMVIADGYLSYRTSNSILLMNIGPDGRIWKRTDS